MTPKKNVVTQVGSALGAAAARVENLKPKRASNAKHTKAQASVIEDTKIEIAQPEPIKATQLSEREEIEITAYLYAESRGFQGGSQEEDWVRAEREVLQRRAKNA